MFVQYCAVKAYEIADRVRAGEVVPAGDLAAALDELAAAPWSTEMYQAKRAAELALFATGSREGLHRAVTERLASFGPATIRGILLAEGDPLSEPLPANPWGIAASASLRSAIDQVWNHVDAPALTRALRERVLGLVLLERGGQQQLGYLHVHELEGITSRPPHDRRDAPQWLPFGDITLFVGNAPAVGTHPVPAPLERFYRVHAGLRDTLWNLAGPARLVPWHDMLGCPPTQQVSPDADEPIEAQQLLGFFGYGDDRSDLFDLRDPDEPLVLAWGDGQLYGTVGVPFPEWLDSQTSLFLGISDG